MKKRHLLIALWLVLPPPLTATAGDPVVIQGKVIIESPVVYDNTVIQLQHGSFIITKNASLTITNSRIEGLLSPAFSPLFDVADGRLTLKNNTVAVTTFNLPASPLSAPRYALINIHSGTTSLIQNDFSIDKPYTAALLLTGSAQTAGIIATGNTVNLFHGGILLQNSANGTISGNTFFRVSCGNIYIKNSSNIESRDNLILFSGNNNVGDGFDIIDSDNIRIMHNHILSGSCYSIFCMRSSHVVIADNTISGGITYAVYTTDKLTALHPGYTYLNPAESAHNKADQRTENSNITITGNYLSQNRYGLAASHVTGLTVKNNFFIQRFKNSKTRQFWTNNDILLKNITGLLWRDNLYREGFSQEKLPDNKLARHFVDFPEHNGVVFE